MEFAKELVEVGTATSGTGKSIKGDDWSLLISSETLAMTSNDPPQFAIDRATTAFTWLTENKKTSFMLLQHFSGPSCSGPLMTTLGLLTALALTVT